MVPDEVQSRGADESYGGPRLVRITKLLLISLVGSGLIMLKRKQNMAHLIQMVQWWCFDCMDHRIKQVESLGWSALRQVDEGNWQRLEHKIESGCTKCGKDAQFKVYRTAI